MSKLAKYGNLGKAAAAVGIDPKTARKYRDLGCLPSQIDKPPRTYRTRQDPFEDVWPEIEVLLNAAPELEAKALFEHLCELHPDRFHEGQLRSLQRRIKRWRSQSGPAREIFFEQCHRPGEALQTDFTWANELEVTIAGQPFKHMLYHSVLPYSNWEHVCVCRSESLVALRRGLQATLQVLGHVPKVHQTDNTTAATHNLGNGKRSFNDDYLALLAHYKLEARTIAIGEKEQNGDIESSHGVLKRRMKQHLLLRGSRDFESVEAYEGWISGIVSKANRLRQKRFCEELSLMRPLTAAPLPEFTELRVKVTRFSNIRVLRNTYSVPSRLRNEELLVKIYEDRLVLFFAGQREFEVERLLGDHKHRINYRHIIESLVRKPGAFARYRFREDLFPTLTFRRAYDSLCAALSERSADLQYLQILLLAARTMECDVEAALDLLLGQGLVPSCDLVKELLDVEQRAPELTLPAPDLASYDEFFEDLEALKEVA